MKNRNHLHLLMVEDLVFYEMNVNYMTRDLALDRYDDLDNEELEKEWVDNIENSGFEWTRDMDGKITGFD